MRVDVLMVTLINAELQHQTRSGRSWKEPSHCHLCQIGLFSTWKGLLLELTYLLNLLSLHVPVPEMRYSLSLS